MCHERGNTLGAKFKIEKYNDKDEENKTNAEAAYKNRKQENIRKI